MYPSTLLRKFGLCDCKFHFFREIFKNTFMTDGGQIRAEIQRSIYSNTSRVLNIKRQQ